MRDEKGRFTKKVIEIEELPEKWCIDRQCYPEVREWFSKHATSGADYDKRLNGWMTCYPSFGNGNYSIVNKPRGYTEITIEQFRKYVLKQEEFKLPEKWCVQKNHQDVVDWCNRKNPSATYTLTTRNDAWVHNDRPNGLLLYDVPLLGYQRLTLDEFRKHILNQKKMYKISQLFTDDVIVYLRSKEEHAKLKEASDRFPWGPGKGLCNWTMPACYNLASYTYSGTSTKTNKGGYPDSCEIITIDQIDFSEVPPKKVIGYNFKPSMKQYEQAALTIAQIPDWNRFNPHLTSDRCITLLKSAAVLDIWFDPVYEKEYPRINIGGHDAKFEEDCFVQFGCKRFTKEEVLGFGNVLVKSGLKIETYNDQVLDVYRYFKEKS